MNLTMLHKTNLRVVTSLFLISAFIAAPLIQTSYAHQIALYTIKDKNHLFEVEWANEPVAVDDKTNVEFTALYPNATDPTNPEDNGTQPITGLENSLKVEISAGDKNMTSDLEPAFGDSLECMNLKHSIRPLQLHTVLEYFKILTK